MKTITLTSKNQITIPAEIVRQMGLDQSRKLRLERHGDAILLTSQKDLATQLNNIQHNVAPYVVKSFTDAQLARGRQEAWLARNA